MKCGGGWWRLLDVTRASCGQRRDWVWGEFEAAQRCSGRFGLIAEELVDAAGEAECTAQIRPADPQNSGGFPSFRRTATHWPECIISCVPIRLNTAPTVGA